MVGDVLSALSDYLVPAFGAVGAWMMWATRKLLMLEDDAADRDRTLTGDEDDPAVPGALHRLHEIEGKVDHLDEILQEHREESAREHRQVVDRLDDLAERVDARRPESADD